jgi:hypothetical protein
MNISGLSFSGLPPIDIPFRFFVTAIALIIGLAFFVFLSGESLWLSRWHPSMLALTHGFTLGFMTPVMMGALLQMLPVVSGIGIRNVRRVGWFCYPLHFVGTSLLIWGFVANQSFQPTIKILAISCLILSFSYYIFAVAQVLWQYFRQQLMNNVFTKNPTIVAIAYSILALLVTVTLGVILQSQQLGFSLFLAINIEKELTNIHALWGGIGWMSVLILAVSLQVIPMFHVAPRFPKLVAHFIPIILLFSLLFSLLALFAFPKAMPTLLTILLVAFVTFNLVLLSIIWQRKRKVPDITINCWRVAVIALVVILLLYLSPERWFSEVFLIHKTTFLGAAFIYFYLLTILQGMLFKILPFLSYTHLQQRCLSNFDAMQYLPNMHELLSKKLAKLLFCSHIVVGGFLLLTVLNPSFYWLFSVGLLIEFILFLFIIMGTCRVYYRSLLAIKQLEEKLMKIKTNECTK